MTWEIEIEKEIEGKKVINHYFDVECYNEIDSFYRTQTVKSKIKTLDEAFNKAVECIKQDKDYREEEWDIKWYYVIVLNEETADTTYTTMFKVYEYKGEYRIKQID